MQLAAFKNAHAEHTHTHVAYILHYKFRPFLSTESFSFILGGNRGAKSLLCTGERRLICLLSRRKLIQILVRLLLC